MNINHYPSIRKIRLAAVIPLLLTAACGQQPINNDLTYKASCTDANNVSLRANPVLLVSVDNKVTGKHIDTLNMAFTRLGGKNTQITPTWGSDTGNIDVQVPNLTGTFLGNILVNPFFSVSSDVVANGQSIASFKFRDGILSTDFECTTNP